MGALVLRRGMSMLAMLLALSLVMFALLRLSPGDPVLAYLDPSVSYTPADLAAMRARFGLDQPLPVQFLSWVGHAAEGDLGVSTQHERAPVRALIAERIGPTLLLMGTGLVAATAIGLAAGVLASLRPGGAFDFFSGTLGSLGISSPAFLTALLGLFVVAVRLRWAPSGGMTAPGAAATPGEVFRHLWLPAGIFALAQAPQTMRFARSAMLETLGQDYIRTARAKGLKERWIIVRHALRNALIPVITLVGANIGVAIGGAVFIESVFNWPGMGLLLVNAVEARDYPLIMGTALVIGACVLVANLLADIACAAADPRLRAG
jgi:peptide/nickel transport system permease protein